ncbi:DUF502 domain-containing protein [Defluviitalea phaphyphila]|uniref:DUF502 domain-containing protein n=1 Tax=Defluviitalea phaphyphila TaxID=1473580 RepID=UPI000731AFD1|nr:DUF502 domain-containing protein [Defluviitalea phaphyphila]
MKKLKNLFYNNEVRQSFLELRRLFLSGLVSILPIAFTFYTVGLVFNFADKIPRNIIARIIVILLSIFNKKISVEEVNVPGLGLIASIFLIIVVGYISTNWIGKGIIKLIENWILKIPVVGNVYTGISQIMNSILTKKKRAFKEAVLIEYPYKGCYAIGFVTADAPLEILEITKEDLISVFVPTTPNPTSGFMLMMKKTEVYKLNMSVEEAIKMVVSGGILIPDKN